MDNHVMIKLIKILKGLLKSWKYKNVTNANLQSKKMMDAITWHAKLANMNFAGYAGLNTHIDITQVTIYLDVQECNLHKEIHLNTQIYTDLLLFY